MFCKVQIHVPSKESLLKIWLHLGKLSGQDKIKFEM